MCNLEWWVKFSLVYGHLVNLMNINSLRAGFFSPSVSASLGLHRPPSKLLILGLWPCVLCTPCFTRWKGSLFSGMRLYSRFYIPVARCLKWGLLWSWWFLCKLSLLFLDNTQKPITIYTRARVSLLSSCSLEHGLSIIAEKRAVETQFLLRL